MIKRLFKVLMILLLIITTPYIAGMGLQYFPFFKISGFLGLWLLGFSVSGAITVALFLIIGALIELINYVRFG